MVSWRSVAPLGAVVSLVFFFSATAEAQLAHRLAEPRVPREGFTLDLHVGTAFPLAVGAGLRLRTPGRFLVDVWAGGVPDGYAGIASDIASSYGAGSEATTLLRAVSTGAALVRLGIGVQPIENAGLELCAGYTLFYAAPTLTRQTVEEATGQSFAPAGDTIGFELAVHAVHVEVGYALELFDHLVLRAGIGLSVAVGASAHLDVPEAMRAVTPIVGRIESDIASTIPGRAIVPELRLLAGGRF